MPHARERTNTLMVAEVEPRTQAPPEPATIEALMALLRECYSELAVVHRHGIIKDDIDREHIAKAFAYSHSALTIARLLLEPQIGAE